MYKYTIEIFYSEDDEGYIAIVPELKGCSAFGKTEIEALEEVKKEKPDLISLDLVMPKKSGAKFYHDLTKNKEWAKIPVIIVTTKDQETDRVWGLRQGATDFLTKPVSEKMLMEKINAALAAA